MITAFAFLPLALLIILMVKKDSMPAAQALPLCALVAYLVVLGIFRQPWVLANASVIHGALLALTPISIVAGAVFLFKTMDLTGAITTLNAWMNHVSSSAIAQLMIIGWAFTFLLEGASGFGTPAAIAAPVLVGLGFPAMRVAVFCLTLNTIPVAFGAVGTPIWFGLSMLSLSDADLFSIAWFTALINTLVAPVVVFVALKMMSLSWRQLWNGKWFILLSTFSCTVPHLVLSLYSYEFPSLGGGAIGLVTTLLLAKCGLGLKRDADAADQSAEAAPSRRQLIKASFPLWGTVIVLLLTRLKSIGLKDVLQSTQPAFTWDVGAVGQLELSASLVVTLSDIIGTPLVWRHSILYVPSLLPFVFVGIMTLLVYRKNVMGQALSETLERLKTTVFALIGALIFVNMMMLGDEQSPVAVIGGAFALLVGEHWAFFSPMLGAIGSFFSGSATISNLTFGGVQQSIAHAVELPVPLILSLQTAGAAMGNMVCINNIVAVTAILGLKNKDGDVLRRTFVALMVYAVVAGVAGIVLARLG